jgi:hypothetical protein
VSLLMASALPAAAAALKIWVFSGDVDGIVPVLGSRRWIESLQLPVAKPWRSWTSRTGQVGQQPLGGGRKVGLQGGGGWVGSNVLKSRLLQPPVAKAWWSPNSRTDPVGGSRASRASGGGGGWGDGCWAAVAGLLRHCGCRVGRPSLLCRGGPGEAGRPLLDCVSAAAGRQTQLGGAGASAGVWVFWGGGWAAVAGLSHCSCLWQNLAVLHQQNVRVVLFTHPGAAGGSSFVVHGLHGSTREC